MINRFNQGSPRSRTNVFHQLLYDGTNLSKDQDMRVTSLRIMVFMLMGIAICCCEEPIIAPDPVLTFAWIPKSLDNGVFNVGLRGARKKAQELTRDTKYTVKIKYLAPSTAANDKNQAKLISQAVDEGVNGIGISCNSPEGAVKEAIKEAIENDVQVMTWDSDSPGSGRFTYLGVDNRKGGEYAARILAKSMKGTTNNKVMLLSGTPNSKNLNARIKGFVKEIEDHTDLEILDLDPQPSNDDDRDYSVALYCNDSPIIGAALIERTLAKHPDIGGIFMVGLWPMQLFDDSESLALDDVTVREEMPLWGEAARSGQIKTVAYDTLRYQLKFVKKDSNDEQYVQALIGQNYWDWGYKTIEQLFERVVNGNDFDDVNDDEFDIVCANNVKEMEEIWKKKNFNKKLKPECDLLE